MTSARSHRDHLLSFAIGSPSLSSVLYFDLAKKEVIKSGHRIEQQSKELLRVGYITAHANLNQDVRDLSPSDISAFVSKPMSSKTTNPQVMLPIFLNWQIK